MRCVINKRGDVMQMYLIQIMLSGLFVVLFLMATVQKSDSRLVKQQVLERELVLLIDSAAPGMSFVVNKGYRNGIVQDVFVQGGRIFVAVDGLVSLKGYSYFTKYSVVVREFDDRFVIEVRESG